VTPRGASEPSGIGHVGGGDGVLHPEVQHAVVLPDGPLQRHQPDVVRDVAVRHSHRVQAQL